jgi:hypothetical protein
MYKSLSDAMQHAKQAMQKKNEHGVDPTVWAKAMTMPDDAPEETGEALKLKLCDLRIEAGKLNTQITDANARKAEGGVLMPNGAYHRLLARRAQVGERITFYERQHAAERIERQKAAALEQVKRSKERRVEHTSFAEAFFEVAKEMLADEVMKRLTPDAGR